MPPLRSATRSGRRSTRAGCWPTSCSAPPPCVRRRLRARRRRWTTRCSGVAACCSWGPRRCSAPPDCSSRPSWTGSIERWLGHPPADLLGSRLLDLVHPEDAKVVAQELAGPSATGTALASYRARHRDGSWHTLEGRVSSGHGDPLVDGVLLSARDVSERVELEREREHGHHRGPRQRLRDPGRRQRAASSSRSSRPRRSAAALARAS